MNFYFILFINNISNMLLSSVGQNPRAKFSRNWKPIQDLIGHFRFEVTRITGFERCPGTKIKILLFIKLKLPFECSLSWQWLFFLFSDLLKNQKNFKRLKLPILYFDIFKYFGLSLTTAFHLMLKMSTNIFFKILDCKESKLEKSNLRI